MATKKKTEKKTEATTEVEKKPKMVKALLKYGNYSFLIIVEADNLNDNIELFTLHNNTKYITKVNFTEVK